MTSPAVSIVTGGSRGIGRAISLQLAELGHQVVVNYASSTGAAEDVVQTIQRSGGSASAFQADIANAAAREALVQHALDTFGSVDVLVNNAGIASPSRRDLLQATEDAWDQVFSINLKGPFFLSQLIANTMLERPHPSGYRRKIVNISSISSFTASTSRGDYCMTKAALSMMTLLFADRLAEHEIGVFEISPGIIETDMTGPVREKYDGLIAGGLTPIRRWGQPDDVARAVSAIVSDCFPFSTGERINVDGGFHIRRL